MPKRKKTGGGIDLEKDNKLSVGCVESKESLEQRGDTQEAMDTSLGAQQRCLDSRQKTRHQWRGGDI